MLWKAYLKSLTGTFSKKTERSVVIDCFLARKEFLFLESTEGLLRLINDTLLEPTPFGIIHDFVSRFSLALLSIK